MGDLVSKIKRTIISDKPRVTKFNIDWANGSACSGKRLEQAEESQSKLEDYFSASLKSRPEEPESTSQK